MPHVLSDFTGPSREGTRVWHLGPRLEGVAVLHEGYHAPAGALAGEPAVTTV
jgi:hypothetical protein